MREVVNLLNLEPGDVVEMSDGATVEVVSNLGDGMWIFGRFITSPSDPSQEGTEEMIFAQEIVAQLKSP
jgi:hypothetical protein